MKIELKRKEALLIIEGLEIRISKIETLLPGFESDYLIEQYTDELNTLKELKLKIAIETNKEYYQTI
jgi:hypothetical protein